ncbi:MAG TPA: cysteine--tRNA ligase [Bellilinea sp.]|nr:cysteine--tRNA ligase [Bellilinea sp.]
MADLILYNTLNRQLEKFEPLHPPKVGLYTCGPTVYLYAHIGNLRTYIFEDFLRRVLEWNGFEVDHVMNITDVGHLVSDADEGEDKMEKGSRISGKSAWEIADFYTTEFQKDLVHLNILEPKIWCRATDHIKEQVEFIQCIEKNGYTYQTSDGIYFDTAKQDDYGYLGRLDKEGLRAGARIDMGEKRNPTDFALWKFSPKDHKRQMEWESPWGTGFPGWHIECSAMSAKYLGPLFDIHAGGEDHITVHHTNEIAQTEACYGTTLARFWVHGYFLQLEDSHKMSKSSQNFLRVATLIEREIDPLAYRFFCMSASYRQKLTFSWDGLEAAAKSLDKLRRNVFDLGAPGEADEALLDRFTSFVNDDLNIPRAIALTWEVLKADLPAEVRKATILRFDEVLGLRLAEWVSAEAEIPAEIQALLDERAAARKEKRWQDSDRLRDRITAAGFELMDTPEGQKVKPKR